MSDYALDLLSAVRHVATKLEEARLSGRASLALEEMLDYDPLPSDLARIKRHELHDEDAGDQAATRWLIEHAIEDLWHQGETTKSRVQLATDNGSYAFAPGFTLDDLKYKGRKVHAYVDEHKQFGDPFNPRSGKWSDNIRRNTGKDNMAELRESMQAFGWLAEFPAIVDERDVVIVGHRRLAVAEELGIEPVIDHHVFGDGDDADAHRLKLAIGSNLGAKGFTKEERREMAEYLYGEREWSQEKIAEALGVSQQTISRDLGAITHMSNSKSGKRGRKRSRSAELDAQVIADDIEFGGTLNRDQLAEKYHLANGTIDTIRGEERGRREQAQKEETPQEEETPGYDEGPQEEDTSESEATCACCCPKHCPDYAETA